MPDARLIPILTTLLGAFSLWLMLPRGAGRGRGAGAVLGVVALGLGLSQLPLLGAWAADGMFLVLAAVAVISAVGAVTFRNPVYCAVWFGLTLLGTAGLFLFVGAEFLALATIVVYAGAILVTFLFVLMLAQPEGRASYDRVSWEASISAVAGMVMVGVLSMAIGGAISGDCPNFRLGDCPNFRLGDCPNSRLSENGTVPFGTTAASPTADALAATILSPQHVARFGGELFGRHLIAMEVAGCLLLAALVGAAVIVGEERGERIDKPLAVSH